MKPFLVGFGFLLDLFRLLTGCSTVSIPPWARAAPTGDAIRIQNFVRLVRNSQEGK